MIDIYVFVFFVFFVFSVHLTLLGSGPPWFQSGGLGIPRNNLSSSVVGLEFQETSVGRRCSFIATPMTPGPAAPKVQMSQLTSRWCSPECN